MSLLPNNNRSVFLSNGKVVLRPATADDAKTFVRWLNDPEIRIFIQRQFPLYENEELEYIQKIHQRHPKNLHLVIETIEGQTIGSIGLHDIDQVSGTAITGTIIGEKEYQSKGYGTAAKKLLLEHAFYTLNLRKIYSHVLAYNKRSIAYALTCGYKQEAVFKKHMFRNGKYHDMVILSIFEKDFRAKIKEKKH